MQSASYLMYWEIVVPRNHFTTITIVLCGKRRQLWDKPPYRCLKHVQLQLVVTSPENQLLNLTYVCCMIRLMIVLPSENIGRVLGSANTRSVGIPELKHPNNWYLDLFKRIDKAHCSGWHVLGYNLSGFRHKYGLHQQQLEKAVRGCFQT